MSIQYNLLQYQDGTWKDNEPAAVEANLAPVVRDFQELEAHLSRVVGKTKIATSGFFNPLHKNHISNLLASRLLPADIFTENGLPTEIHLTVVVNGDWSTKQKLGGEIFMSAEHRADIVRAIRGVDLVCINDVHEDHQGELISKGYFDIFTKGGDRDFASLPVEEQEALHATNTMLVTSVGYSKHEGTADEVSSTKLRNVAKGKL